MAAFTALVALGLVVGLGLIGRRGGGPLRRVDTWVYSWIPVNQFHTTGTSLAFAHLFSVGVLGPLSVAVGVGLWLGGRRLRSLVPILAFLGAEAMVLILKVSVALPPPRAPANLRTLGLAFPSGHAAASAAVLLALAPMASERAGKLWPWAVAVVVSLITCLTRMMLRVHWFSDVAVGWSLGALWGLAVAATFAPLTPGRPDGLHYPRWTWPRPTTNTATNSPRISTRLRASSARTSSRTTTVDASRDTCTC